MALNGTGPISLGGSTVGQSVNLELGLSATAQISFNDTVVRNLTGTSSGTALIMPTNFYNKSSILDTQTVTVGVIAGANNVLQDRTRGYSSIDIYGSISDGTSNIPGYGGATIEELAWIENGGASYYDLSLSGSGLTNSGWSSMTIGSKTLNRANANSVFIDSISAYWQWDTSDSISTQAFGSVGSIVTVTFKA